MLHIARTTPCTRTAALRSASTRHERPERKRSAPPPKAAKGWSEAKTPFADPALFLHRRLPRLLALLALSGRRHGRTLPHGAVGRRVSGGPCFGRRCRWRQLRRGQKLHGATAELRRGDPRGLCGVGHEADAPHGHLRRGDEASAVEVRDIRRRWHELRAHHWHGAKQALRRGLGPGRGRRRKEAAGAGRNDSACRDLHYQLSPMAGARHR
mmetsp:Transcript_58854/g.170750  ORF Transcript_58854/g.170750 Transcript_58854/m.170750 type:complete len:211 (+) Transcript_58854:11-643(+)